jgi:hypothetical protein
MIKYKVTVKSPTSWTFDEREHARQLVNALLVLPYAALDYVTVEAIDTLKPQQPWPTENKEPDKKVKK